MKVFRDNNLLTTSLVQFKAYSTDAKSGMLATDAIEDTTKGKGTIQEYQEYVCDVPDRRKVEAEYNMGVTMIDVSV